MPQLSSLASELLEEFGWCGFTSVSPDSEGEVFSLSDCEEEMYADGNCHAASTMLSEEVDPAGWGFSEISVAALVSTDGTRFYHAGVSAVLEGQRIIIDFTARQFGEEIPFPLVVPAEEWADVVNTAIETTSVHLQK